MKSTLLMSPASAQRTSPPSAQRMSPPNALVGGPFALLGVGGQAVFVDPKSKVVVVHTAVHKQGDTAARGRQFQFFFATLRKLES